MKTVTLSSLRRDPSLLDRAADGEELLVTRFGKPYVRIVVARVLSTFIGAGKRLSGKKPVSPHRIPRSEWNGVE